MNNITDKDIQNPEKVEKIELVLEDFYKMELVSLFPNVKSLTLINCSIDKI